MRSSSVATALLHECTPIDTGGGWLIFKDLVATPPRRLLAGLGTPQVLVQFENERGDVVDLTVPETAALFQTAHSPAGSPTRQALFPGEAFTYVSALRRQEVTRLAQLLRDFEDGEEVFGVRLPQKGGGRIEGRRRFGGMLEQAGYTGVSPAGQHRLRSMLRASGWDPAVLLTEADLTPPLDPLIHENEALVLLAREYMTIEVAHQVEPTPASVARDFDPWLRKRYGQTAYEAGYKRADLRRIFRELARPYRLGSDVATSDSKRARPKGVQGRLTASLPYESLQIDAWTIDCQALNQYGKPIRLFLLTAVDTVVRKLRALRFCSHEPTMQDIKLLIFDTVKGRPIWPVGDPVCPRLPGFVDLGTELIEHLRKKDPDYTPTGMIHVDNGSAMIGTDVLEAAARFGIHVQPARPGRGSDKGGVESFFATLAEFASRLPGAVGSKATRRPRQVTRILSIQHLEIFLRLWVEVVYHERPHSGLQDPRFPNRKMSPNSYEQHLLLTHGSIAVSMHPFGAVGLLPMVSEARLATPGKRPRGSRRDEVGRAVTIPTRRVAHDEGFRNRLRDYDSDDTERLKEYTQGAKSAGLPSRPVTVYEHPGDPDAIIVRDVNGDLIVVPHRDLMAPEPPLTDEADRNLRELLLMAAPAPTASEMDKRLDLIVAAAHAMSQPMPKRAPKGAAATAAKSSPTAADWAEALRQVGA